MAYAEKKYDLALKSTLTDKKIRQKPWYEERLKTKQTKSMKNNDTSKHLIGKNWIFIKDGLDDFRDGLPPPVEGDIMIKGNKGPGPNIKGSSDSASPVKQPAVRNRFTKYQVCYSRSTPLQQQRRDHIDEIEYGLTQHPLALYPHLEEGVPPEVFEDIVDILDPEMNLASDDESFNEEEEVEETTSQIPEESEKREAVTSPVTKETEEVFRNPYRWLPRKEEKDKKDKKKANEKRSHSPSEEVHIKHVTKDFCDWVAALGGDSNNIEESTIMSLFASGYETKPALSVPIHVVELTNVPPELRMSAAVPPPQESSKATPQTGQEPSKWSYSGGYEPSWVKFRYGAWYLNPKSWKKMNFEDPLQDPKEIKNQEMSEAKKKSSSLNQELAAIHGSQAFMEFIDKKATRKPEFLDEVAEIQRKAAEEEQRKQEAELAAKQKRISVRKDNVGGK